MDRGSTSAEADEWQVQNPTGVEEKTCWDGRFAS